MADEMGIFEAMSTQRAIRRLKPDPIPDELVRKVIEAGTHAPNGANVQNWAFIVIKDPELKRRIGEHYRLHSPFRSEHAIYPNHGDNRMRSASRHLDDHIQDAPVLILACIKHDGSPSDIARGASIFPAVQNMLLAARALGLGSVITTRQRGWFEEEIKEMLGIPENVDTAALLPLGYPDAGNRYGPTTRQPVEEVAYSDRWGQKWQVGN